MSIHARMDESEDSNDSAILSKKYDIQNRSTYDQQKKIKLNWELKNVFGNIYTTIQRILRRYHDDDWAPISNGFYLSSIDSSYGSPKTTFVGERRRINLERFQSVLELHFGNPQRIPITCSQWQKYVAINNSLSRIYSSVKEYNKIRKETSHPSRYLSVLFHDPIPEIGHSKYSYLLRFCFDFNDSAESNFPWPR